jgi:hypothetical protein
MGVLAAFGITNDGLNLVVNLLLLFLVVLWFALIYWTYSDARRRISDPMLVGCATAASLFPYVGTVVYMIVRPPEYLEDVRERELEMLAAEARLQSIEQHLCQYCGFEIESTFLRCPSCLRRLKEPCATCGKPLDPRWKICPYCEAEVGQAQRRPVQQEGRAAPDQRAAPAQRPALEQQSSRTAAAQRPQSRAAARAPAPEQQREPRPSDGGRAERPTRERGSPERTRP